VAGRRPAVRLAIGCALVAVTTAPLGQQRLPRLAETATVTLMLLDVEVTDENGAPVRGLTRRDFSARLDGRDWPIATVDDLCQCRPAEPPSPASPTASGAASDSTASANPAPAAGSGEPVQYIIYLDFSQLQTDGRGRAVKEAKRWIAERLLRADRAMIAAYSTAAGQRTLCPFTEDRSRLVSALDATLSNPVLIDPFPSYLETRIQECINEPWICALNAADEYHHGRRSLESLKRFLTRLETVPGRKQLLLFHQNGVIHPGRLYGRPESDHQRRLEDVAAEATVSRVVIHPLNEYDTVTPGVMSKEVGGFGFYFADATGGIYNRGPSDLARVLDETRLRCPCLYRIGLTPPEGKTGAIHRVAIKARGRTIPHDYVARSFTEMDRWLRTAQAVLADPAGARDLPVTAGLVPVRAVDGRWELQVQVALDMGALTMLPSAAGLQGGWEVGAALARIGTGEEWEMLGLSEVRSYTGSSAWVVHQRSFTHLRPGRFRLVAFVRDRAANVFGGAEADLVLPKPSKGSPVGPILMRSDRRQIVSGLPLLTKAQKGESSRGAAIATGPIPAGDAPAGPDEPLEAATWICGAQPRPDRLRRYLSEEGSPILRFEEPRTEPAGECLKITDRIERWRPRPGRYAYHLRWDEAGRTTAVELPFEIASPAGAVAAR